MFLRIKRLTTLFAEETTDYNYDTSMSRRRIEAMFAPLENFSTVKHINGDAFVSKFDIKKIRELADEVVSQNSPDHLIFFGALSSILDRLNTAPLGEVDINVGYDDLRLVNENLFVLDDLAKQLTENNKALIQRLRTSIDVFHPTNGNFEGSRPPACHA